MAKAETMVVVKTIDEFTYRVDESSTRTLPKGWEGPVRQSVADDLKEAGKGDIVAAKKAAKKAED
ncbi:MAG: hypothetical protein AAGL89_15685 [Pseudomonadota bacterium]